MGIESRDTNDELVEHVASLSQDELRTAITKLWQERGYTVHDRDSQWLSVTRGEETGLLLVAAPDTSVDVRSSIESASDPVTVVTPYGVDSKVHSWIKRSDRATLLDATDLARIAREEDVVSDVFDRPASDSGTTKEEAGVLAELATVLIPAVAATWALWSTGVIVTTEHADLPSLIELPGFLAAWICLGCYYASVSHVVRHGGHVLSKIGVAIGTVAVVTYATGRYAFGLPMDSPQTLVAFGGAVYVLVALPFVFPVRTGTILGGTAGLVHRVIKWPR